MQQSDLTGFNWFLGSAWEPISRGSASLAHGGKLEAQPPDLCYQALPGNEENPMGSGCSTVCLSVLI